MTRHQNTPTTTTTPAPTPEAQVSEYRLSPVPITDTNPDGWAWDVTVRPCRDGWHRYTGTWEARSRVSVLSTSGRWDPIPNETSPAWCREHEFPDAAGALAAAERALPTLRISGRTPADVTTHRLDSGDAS